MTQLDAVEPGAEPLRTVSVESLVKPPPMAVPLGQTSSMLS